jgi:hypothetical protein
MIILVNIEIELKLISFVAKTGEECKHISPILVTHGGGLHLIVHSTLKMSFFTEFRFVQLYGSPNAALSSELSSEHEH